MERGIRPRVDLRHVQRLLAAPPYQRYLDSHFRVA